MHMCVYIYNYYTYVYLNMQQYVHLCNLGPWHHARYNQDGHLVPKDWFVIVLPDDPGAHRWENFAKMRDF